MKKILLLIAINLITIGAFAQEFSDLGNVSFSSQEDYKLAEPMVLECSNYLLNNPADKDELIRLNSFQYLLKWMEGTADYTFSIGDEAMKLTNGKTELLMMYFASMTKLALENTNTKLTDAQIEEKATNYLIDYCSKPENNLKPSKYMKKIIKRRKT